MKLKRSNQKNTLAGHFELLIVSLFLEINGFLNKRNPENFGFIFIFIKFANTVRKTGNLK
jgi:hypothetical protein